MVIEENNTSQEENSIESKNHLATALKIILNKLTMSMLMFMEVNNPL